MSTIVDPRARMCKSPPFARTTLYNHVRIGQYQDCYLALGKLLERTGLTDIGQGVEILEVSG